MKFNRLPIRLIATVSLFLPMISHAQSTNPVNFGNMLTPQICGVPSMDSDVMVQIRDSSTPGVQTAIICKGSGSFQPLDHLNYAAPLPSSDGSNHWIEFHAGAYLCRDKLSNCEANYLA